MIDYLSLKVLYVKFCPSVRKKVSNISITDKGNFIQRLDTLRNEVDKIKSSFEPNRRLSVQLSVYKEVFQFILFLHNQLYSNIHLSIIINILELNSLIMRGSWSRPGLADKKPNPKPTGVFSPLTLQKNQGVLGFLSFFSKKEKLF